MKDYLSRAGKLLLIIAVVVLAVAYVNERMKPIVKLVPVQDPNHIPSIMETQKRLKATGKPRYDPGPIDNIPGPRFMRALNNYTKDQYAKRAIEGG